MARPDITKKLSLIAWNLAGICTLIRLVMPFCGRPVVQLLYHMDAAPTPCTIALLLAAEALWLPFVGVLLWHWTRQQVTENATMAVLILAPGLYLLAGLLRGCLPRLFYRAMDAEQIGVYGVMASMQSMLSVFLIAALVLVCCAASIEMYLLRHPPTTIDLHKSV